MRTQIVSRSYMDSTVLLEDRFCAVTVVSFNNHAQLVAEWLEDSREHVMKIADLTGNKSGNGIGTVKLCSISIDELKKNDQSKTWKVSKSVFFSMWSKVEEEADYPDVNPVYFHNVGKDSILAKKFTDLKPIDAVISEIKQYAPALFQKICHEALKFNSKNKQAAIRLCNESLLWKGGFKLVTDLARGKKTSDPSHRIGVAQQVLELFKNSLEGSRFLIRTVRAHNCTTWIKEKLEDCGIKVKRPFFSFLVMAPSKFIKLNKLTTSEKNQRKKTDALKVEWVKKETYSKASAPVFAVNLYGESLENGTLPVPEPILPEELEIGKVKQIHKDPQRRISELEKTIRNLYWGRNCTAVTGTGTTTSLLVTTVLLAIFCPPAAIGTGVAAGITGAGTIASTCRKDVQRKRAISTLKIEWIQLNYFHLPHRDYLGNEVEESSQCTACKKAQIEWKIFLSNLGGVPSSEIDREPGSLATNEIEELAHLIKLLKKGRGQVFEILENMNATLNFESQINEESIFDVYFAFVKNWISKEINLSTIDRKSLFTKTGTFKKFDKKNEIRHEVLSLKLFELVLTQLKDSHEESSSKNLKTFSSSIFQAVMEKSNLLDTFFAIVGNKKGSEILDRMYLTQFSEGEKIKGIYKQWEEIVLQHKGYQHILSLLHKGTRTAFFNAISLLEGTLDITLSEQFFLGNPMHPSVSGAIVLLSNNGRQLISDEEKFGLAKFCAAPDKGSEFSELSVFIQEVIKKSLWVKSGSQGEYHKFSKDFQVGLHLEDTTMVSKVILKRAS